MLRVLLAELTRINSHLVFVGATALDLGASSLFLYCLARAREDPGLLRGHERRADDDQLHPPGRPGARPRAGVPGDDVDVPRLDARATSTATRTLLTGNPIFKERTERHRGADGRGCAGAGRQRADAARPLASRWTSARPIRTAATRRTTSTCRPGTVGDCYDRYLVRVAEMRESVQDLSRRRSTGCPAGRCRQRTARSCRRRAKSWPGAWRR